MRMDALQEILRDFDREESAVEGDSKRKAPLTIWLSIDDKARYDRLQKTSGRKFGKKLREVIQAALDYVDKSA